MQIYLPVEDIILELHDAILDISGGRTGIIKPDIIDAAINRPKTYLMYHPDCNLHTVCAVLLDSLARNHAFADGNKRTGLMTVVLTYELNGIALKSGADRTDEFENLVLWVVNDKPSIEQIASKLERLIHAYASKRGVSKFIASIKAALTPVSSPEK